MRFLIIYILFVLFITEGDGRRKGGEYHADRYKEYSPHHGHYTHEDYKDHLHILKKIYNIYNEDVKEEHYKEYNKPHYEHARHSTYAKDQQEPHGIHHHVHVPVYYEKPEKHHHKPQAYSKHHDEEKHHHHEKDHHHKKEDNHKEHYSHYYQFGYQVNEKKNVSHGHMEFQKGGKKVGQYKIQLPDGRLQVVSYEADSEGFRPIIRYVNPHEYKDSSGESTDILVSSTTRTPSTYWTSTTTSFAPTTFTRTTTVVTTTTVSSSTSAIPYYENKVHKEEKKEPNIIVIQLPDSYEGNNHDKLKSTVYNLLSGLSAKKPSFGNDDYISPIRDSSPVQYDLSNHRSFDPRRPSLRFTEKESLISQPSRIHQIVPQYIQSEYYASSVDPYRTFTDPHSIHGGTSDYYIITGSHFERQNPLYVLTKRKD